jgi:hypothetical protein
VTTWVQTDLEKFFRAFDGYWPNRLKLEAGAESELLKTWRDVAQAFNVAVAMAALRECFESQERPVAPTPAGFKAVAVPMQRFANERVRLAKEERRTGETLYSGMEIAGVDELWEGLLQLAADEGSRGRYDWLVRCRERLARGGSLVEAIGGAR